ncbi:MAG: response regulator [Candidatus Pacearchaeota archaeon]|nr:response regulator [Candidatus Pacearchaeota archaeon]
MPERAAHEKKSPSIIKILVLDNEKKWHDAVEKILSDYYSKKGIKAEFIHAYNPEDAIKSYEKFKPQLVISDVCMGPEDHHRAWASTDKDGIDKFVKPIHEKYKNDNIIVMTSDNSFDVAVEALEAGARYHILKQNLNESLIKSLEEMEK